MSQQCVALGVAAVVIDGAVRDCEAFPMYAAGMNPNGPTKFVPGRLNHPISIGGVSVSPGDLVVGDADGVTVVERDKAAAIGSRCSALNPDAAPLPVRIIDSMKRKDIPPAEFLVEARQNLPPPGQGIPAHLVRVDARLQWGVSK